MEITVYTRHSKNCPYRSERFSKRCSCRKWLDYWLDGKQIRETAKTRSWETAVKLARKKERDHENARLGIVAAPKAITVEEAVTEWLKIRKQGGIQNDKAKAMSDRLVEWCDEHNITFVPEITTPLVMKFRMSLPFRSGDSSSLKIHWSVIGGFFRWCKGMGYVAQSPVPSARENPQFRITFKQKEVVPPSKEEVEKVLSTATGKTKLLAQLMRWSGMAIGDAIFRDKNTLEGSLIRGNRRKTGERFRVRIPQSLADALPSFTDDINWKSPVHYWEKQLRQVFKDAGVEMTPHHFRHFRVTELLSSGVRVEDVALMVGTSPQEIRKTYQHWIRETEDRLDEQQKQEFLSQGLDENGNQVIQ
jgi:integrase